jgi:hypothetical protein
MLEALTTFGCSKSAWSRALDPSGSKDEQRPASNWPRRRSREQVNSGATAIYERSGSPIWVPRRGLIGLWFRTSPHPSGTRPPTELQGLDGGDEPCSGFVNVEGGCSSARVGPRDHKRAQLDEKRAFCRSGFTRLTHCPACDSEQPSGPETPSDKGSAEGSPGTFRTAPSRRPSVLSCCREMVSKMVGHAELRRAS